MSLDKIKAKLAELNKQSQRPGNSNSNNNLFWKPGQQKDSQGNCLPDQIRLLPNKFSVEPDDYPFLDLPLYTVYKNPFGKTWLSPAFNHEPDPIIEYCNSLMGEFVPKDQWETRKEIKKKLSADNKFAALVLPRGLEQEGPKWWVFGVEVFNQIGPLFVDDDYTGLVDMKRGFDLKITYTPENKQTNTRAKTAVLVKPNRCIATEDPEVLEKIEKIVSIATVYKIPTYDELQDALNAYLKIEPEVKPKANRDVRIDHDATNQGFDVPERKSVPKNSDVDISDIEALFDNDFFKED